MPVKAPFWSTYDYQNKHFQEGTAEAPTLDCQTVKTEPIQLSFISENRENFEELLLKIVEKIDNGETIPEHGIELIHDTILHVKNGKSDLLEPQTVKLSLLNTKILTNRVTLLINDNSLGNMRGSFELSLDNLAIHNLKLNFFIDTTCTELDSYLVGFAYSELDDSSATYCNQEILSQIYSRTHFKNGMKAERSSIVEMSVHNGVHENNESTMGTVRAIFS